MVLSKNDVRLISLKSLGPPEEFLSGLGMNTTLTWHNMAENVASHQTGMKNHEEGRDKDPPSLLQQGREYPIHSWTFVWGK